MVDQVEQRTIGTGASCGNATHSRYGPDVALDVAVAVIGNVAGACAAGGTIDGAQAVAGAVVGERQSAFAGDVACEVVAVVAIALIGDALGVATAVVTGMEGGKPEAP